MRDRFITRHSNTPAKRQSCWWWRNDEIVVAFGSIQRNHVQRHGDQLDYVGILLAIVPSFMQTHYRRPVCLLLTSTDLPVWSGIETVGTLYQKDQERFHLIMTEPVVRDRVVGSQGIATAPPITTPRLLWLDFSPYQVTLTMQGQFSYRHVWRQGLYGMSRYWLQDEMGLQSGHFQLRNFTRNLTLETRPLPTFLRVEYELWTAKMQLGQYVLNLEIRH